MNFDTWLAYATACAVLSAIPGPSVLLITAQALNRGLPGACYCLIGGSLGSACLMLLSLLGVGAILSTSATLFFIVKWLGVAYLAGLGVMQIVAASRGDSLDAGPQVSPTSYRQSFIMGFVTALLNPKAIVFYMAFLTQFIDPSRALATQYAVLVSTSLIVAAVVLSCYAVVASRARRALASRRARRNVEYASGGCYLGGSLLMASTR